MLDPFFNRNFILFPFSIFSKYCKILILEDARNHEKEDFL